MAAKGKAGSSKERTAKKKSAATGHAVGNAVKSKPAKPVTRPAKVAESPEARVRALAPEPTQVEFTAAKGRPMLTWVGNRALERVTAFPAQLVKKFSALGAAEPAVWVDWPAGYPQGGQLFRPTTTRATSIWKR